MDLVMAYRNGEYGEVSKYLKEEQGKIWEFRTEHPEDVPSNLKALNSDLRRFRKFSTESQKKDAVYQAGVLTGMMVLLNLEAHQKETNRFLLETYQGQVQNIPHLLDLLLYLERKTLASNADVLDDLSLEQEQLDEIFTNSQLSSLIWVSSFGGEYWYRLTDLGRMLAKQVRKS